MKYTMQRRVSTTLSLLLVFCLMFSLITLSAGAETMESSADLDNDSMTETLGYYDLGYTNHLPAAVNANKNPGGRIFEIYPEDNYRAILQQLEPGDELVFHEGTYYNATFRIYNSGTPEKPIIIRGYGKGEQRPVFVYDANTNPIEVWADNIIISYMEFQVFRGGNTIRISAPSGGKRSNVTVQNSVFRYSPNVAIDSNRGGVTYENIRIINNAFLDMRHTVLYFGSQSGNSPHTGLVVERNYIDASQINNPTIIGYGMELKLNVKGAVVRNNIVVGSQGPGIMVYGADSLDLADANIVEGNIVTGARNSPGILVAAGPSIVRNNLAIGNPSGGIRTYDYGSRGLFHSVVISNNVSAANDFRGIWFTMPPGGYVPQNVTVTDNLVISKEGVPGYVWLPANELDWTISGNEEISSDPELEALIESLQAVRPSEEAVGGRVILHKLWPQLNRLNESPLSMEEVKVLLRKVIEKMQ